MWSILIDTPMFTSMQQGCTNPAGITAYLQLCDHLVTTLKPACGRDKSRVWTTFWQGCHNLVTTLYQPCNNLVPTLPLPCSQVVTRLIQAGHNVVNTWFKDGCTALWQGCHNLYSFFYMGGAASDSELSIVKCHFRKRCDLQTKIDPNWATHNLADEACSANLVDKT